MVKRLALVFVLTLLVVMVSLGGTALAQGGPEGKGCKGIENAANQVNFHSSLQVVEKAHECKAK